MTVQHFGAPGGQTRRQYITLGPLGAKSADSTTLWGPRGPEATTVQHFGAPGGKLQISVAPESSAAPLPPPWCCRCCRCCSFVAVLGPWGPKAPTVQHFGAPGGQKRRQYNTLGPQGPKSDDSTALWGPGGETADFSCSRKLRPDNSVAHLSISVAPTIHPRGIGPILKHDQANLFKYLVSARLHLGPAPTAKWDWKLVSRI